MRFGVLGPVEVAEKKRRLVAGGPKQRTVLALLIANAGHPVSTDSLVQGVYGMDAPDGARRSIQTYVSNLRSEVGDAIEAAGSGYRLNVDRADIDAFVFEDLVASAAATSDPETKSTQLRSGLSLWRGHPYADVDGLHALTTEIGRLNEMRARAIEERVEADLELGRHRDLVAELDSLTEEYPLRERFRAQQMLALYRSGRQAEALRAYERTRNYLVEEMGLDPSRELRDLEQRILEQDPSLAYESGPTVRHVAILVVDVADPRVLSTLEPGDREGLIRHQSESVDDAAHQSEGEVFAHRGSAMYASFDSVEGAVSAAVAAQTVLAEIRHPMRMGIAVGEVQIPSDGSVQGPPLTRAAQLVATGHGGQVLLSLEANQALVDSGEAGWIVRSLGQHDVDGSGEQRPVYQLVIDGLPRDFPPLRTEMLPPPLPIDVRGLPGYELREQVGSGAFGVVHRAYQPSVGREVAVKIIRPEYANDPDFIRHFEVEAQLVARLEHPHIVPLHDYWRSPEGAYLVMRWLRGGTLQDRIASGPLSVEQADALVDQIAPALAFAHRHGVVHRDLKPSNILLDEDGAPYLSDFGIARLEATTTTGSVAGDVRDLAGVVAVALHGQTSNTDVASLLAEATTEDSPYSDVGSFVEAWNRAVGDQPARDHAATYTPTRNPYKGLQAFGELDAKDFYGRDAEIDEIINTLRQRRFVAVVGPSGIGKSSVTRAGAIPALRQGAIDGSEDWLITDMMPGTYPFEELTAALMRVSVEPPRQMEEELRDSDRGLVRYVRRYLPDDTTLLLVIDQFEELFTLSSEAERTEFLEMLAATGADERSNVRVVITMRADFFDRPLRFAELGDALREGTVPVAAPNRVALAEMAERPAHGVGVSFEPGLAERIVSEVHDQPGALPLLEYALAELFASRETDTITAAEYTGTGGVLGALATRAEAIYTSFESDVREPARQILLRLVRVSEGGRATRRRVKLNDLNALGIPAPTVAYVLDAFAAHRLLTFDTDDTSRMPTVEVAHEALLREWPRLAEWITQLQEDLLLHGRLASAAADWEASGQAPEFLLTGGRLTQHEAWVADTDLALSTTESAFLEDSRNESNAKRSGRQRTRRLITAGFGLAAIVAVVLAAFALSARSDAEQEAAVARQKTTEAEASAADAEASATAAENSAEQATRSANLAKAREHAASAISVLDEDPELATLLAIEAFDAAPDDVGLFPEALLALRQAMDANRLVDRLDVEFAKSVAFTPDGGSLLVVDAGSRTVARYAIVGGRLDHNAMWRFEDLTTIDLFSQITIHPDGSIAALQILNEDFGGEPGANVELIDGSDQKPGRVLLLDIATGEQVGQVPLECAQARLGPFAFSGDGSLLTVTQEALPCADDPSWFGTTFFELASLTETERFDRSWVTMTAAMDAILVDHPGGVAELLSYPTKELIETTDIEVGAGVRFISRDGQVIVYSPENNIDTRPGFWSAATNQQLAWGDGFTGFYNEFGTEFTPDGGVFAASSGPDVLYDPLTGRAVLELPTNNTDDIAVSPDGTLAATANDDAIHLWDVGPTGTGTSLTRSDAFTVWVNPDLVDHGVNTGIWGFTIVFDRFERQLAVINPITGEVISHRLVLDEGDQLPDGLFLITPLAVNEDEGDNVLGPLTLWDPISGAETIVQNCTTRYSDVYASAGPDAPIGGSWRGFVCPDGDFFFGIGTAASSDGRLLASIGHDPANAPVDALSFNKTALLRVWDAQTLGVLETHELTLDIGLGNRILPYFGKDWIMLIDGFAGTGQPVTFKIIDALTGDVTAELGNALPWRESVAVSSDEARVYLISEDGVVSEYDTATWEALRSWQASVGRPRGLSVSPNDTFLVVGGEDELVEVFDLKPTDPVVVDRIPLGAWASDTAWIDATTLGVAAMNPGANVEWRLIDLDPISVVSAARRSLVRTFTSTECTLYGIDSCVAYQSG